MVGKRCWPGYPKIDNPVQTASAVGSFAAAREQLCPDTQLNEWDVHFDSQSIINQFLNFKPSGQLKRPVFQYLASNVRQWFGS